MLISGRSRYNKLELKVRYQYTHDKVVIGFKGLDLYNTVLRVFKIERCLLPAYWTVTLSSTLLT